VAFVLVAAAGDGSAIGQAKPALGTLQGLYVRLLIDGQHDGVFGWIQIQSHDVGSLLSELRVGADTPASLALEMYAVFAQYPPYVMCAHVAEMLGDQSAVPRAESLGRRFVQDGQYPSFGVLVVAGWLAAAGGIFQPGYAVGGEASPPFADRRRVDAELLGYLLCLLALVSHEYDLGPEGESLLCGRGIGP
jgi:hypothetical protein